MVNNISANSQSTYCIMGIEVLKVKKFKHKTEIFLFKIPLFKLRDACNYKEIRILDKCVFKTYTNATVPVSTAVVEENPHKISDNGENNYVSFGKNLKVDCRIMGNNNKIIIEDCINPSNLKIMIFGDNNKIIMKKPFRMRELFNIVIGSEYFTRNKNLIYIDEKFSCVRANVYVQQHNTPLTIGKDCMFSSNVEINTGEGIHLIFDKTTGEYLDIVDGIKIGNHVWVGKNVCLLKNTSIEDGCIVGLNSVVTKKFQEQNAVIAGNPAKICKKDIYWERTAFDLDKNSIYYEKLNEGMERLLERDIDLNSL